MFTTVGFFESIDSAALQALTPLADPHVRVSGDNLLVPRGLNKLLMAYALIDTPTRARIVAPSLASFSNLEIEPIDNGTEPSSTYAPLQDYRSSPYEFTPTEFLTVEASEAKAGAAAHFALLWLGDGQFDTPQGEIITVRATSTQTLAANAWTNGSLTFASTLPGGRFACVGARAESTGLVAFRFVPVGTGGNNRPGAIGYDAVSDVEREVFRRGGLGTWFEFDNDTPPTVDFLSISADTAETVWLDLIYLGPSA